MRESTAHHLCHSQSPRPPNKKFLNKRNRKTDRTFAVTMLPVFCVRKGRDSGCDWMMTRLYRPQDALSIKWKLTLMAPALCPNSVIWLGFPPWTKKKSTKSTVKRHNLTKVRDVFLDPLHGKSLIVDAVISSAVAVDQPAKNSKSVVKRHDNGISFARQISGIIGRTSRETLRERSSVNEHKHGKILLSIVRCVHVQVQTVLRRRRRTQT